ncbi:MAG: SCO2322 family protein [Angustibacter sp.]
MTHKRMTRRRAPRLAAGLVIGVLIGLAGGVAWPASAQATAYRFWGYFQLSGNDWSFAQKGADQLRPKDGTVEGWRFAVAEENSTRTPRVTTTFEQLCRSTPPANDRKRIGLVVDFGRPADAESGQPPQPIGRCVSVPTTATGSDVLAAADLRLRVENGLTCAIQGWPATGCGDEVRTVSAAAASPDSPVALPTPRAAAGTAQTDAAEDGGLDPGAWVGVGIAVLAGVVLIPIAVHRSRASHDDR